MLARRVQPDRVSDALGALDPEAVARVREEAWPDPRDAEEVHEALLWMGYVTDAEAPPWRPWLDALAAAGRVVHEGDPLVRAIEASRDPVDVLRGRMEALGPVEGDDPAFLALEAQGHVLRARLGGRDVWCDRRLLARIQRYTLDRLRREIEPVSAATFLRFLAAWQHVDHRLEGPHGVAEVVRQLSGVEVPAAAGRRRCSRRACAATGATGSTPSPWAARSRGGGLGRGRVVAPGRADRVPPRVPTAVDWLDALTLGGEVVSGGGCGREGASPLRAAPPIALFPREDLALPWTPASRRRHAVPVMGRSSCFRRGGPRRGTPDVAETVALRLLARTGVVSVRAVRERLLVPWRDVVRALRLLDCAAASAAAVSSRGSTASTSPLPEATRSAARRAARGLEVSAVDPLNDPHPRGRACARRRSVDASPSADLGIPCR